MLLPVLALAGLLGLVAGLAVYLFMQQKQQAEGGTGASQPEPAAAPRVSMYSSTSTLVLVCREVLHLKHQQEQQAVTTCSLRRAWRESAAGRAVSVAEGLDAQIQD